MKITQTTYAAPDTNSNIHRITMMHMKGNPIMQREPAFWQKFIHLKCQVNLYVKSVKSKEARCLGYGLYNINNNLKLCGWKKLEEEVR